DHAHRKVAADFQLRDLEQQRHEQDDAGDQQAEKRRPEDLLQDVSTDAGHGGMRHPKARVGRAMRVTGVMVVQPHGRVKAMQYDGAAPAGLVVMEVERVTAMAAALVALLWLADTVEPSTEVRPIALQDAECRLPESLAALTGHALLRYRVA